MSKYKSKKPVAISPEEFHKKAYDKDCVYHDNQWVYCNIGKLAFDQKDNTVITTKIHCSAVIKGWYYIKVTSKESKIYKGYTYTVDNLFLHVEACLLRPC